MKSARLHTLKTLLLSALLLPTLAWASTFTFTAIPDQDAAHLQARFDKIAVYLSDKLGVDVKYVPVKSYTAAVTAFRNDQVQLTWFGGLSGVQVHQKVPGSEAIAQGYEDQFFHSYIIANTATGLDKADSLPDTIKGKSFTFGSKGSTSGRLMPEYFLRRQFGATPDQLFSRVGFSGDHSRTIALVQAGSYDLGAVNYTVWERELAEGKIDTRKVKVIWTTPDYQDYQWTIRGDVDARWGEGFKERVRQALLEMKDPELLQAFPRKHFVPARNADYQAILDTARELGLLDP